MEVDQRIRVVDPSNFIEVERGVKLHGKKGFVASIHKNMNGKICYVKLDTYPMTLPLYDYELEEI